MSTCKAFSIENPNEAYEHMKLKRIIQYNDADYDHPLYTWNEGERVLCQCENCGGYVLVQFSEYHGVEDDDYYTDYIEADSP
ncbi:MULTISPECIES: hypothetical protein [unclassified Butyrivibrio]|uniref:hypothetical protein n=1 Tax=unclassified Butyrivibrio TaxID=2639466 RepID=UPI0003B6A23A|nr:MULTISPECIES: hypothetical protein [unclassified Butyrivibrio]MDC7292052.1 hypothetical protein [Butyrivibrio sp. DSM 10294]